MAKRNKIFFASDMHLGVPSYEESLIREKRLVNWLDSIREEASDLYLVGDIFDFWFEYKHAIPKGYVRFLGKLAELADAGVQIHLFTGNHDLWYKDYFPQVFGAKVYTEAIEIQLKGKNFYIAHGDGLGPGDYGYKFIKKIFTNPLCKWLFARFHPNFGIGLANFFSSLSRNYNREKIPVFHGDQEHLYIHARKLLQQQPEIEYFVFGHRHLYRQEEIEKGVKCIYLGDWIRHFSYLELSDEGVELKKFGGRPAAA